jgi:hypothetical protein
VSSPVASFERTHGIHHAAPQLIGVEIAALPGAGQPDGGGQDGRCRRQQGIGADGRDGRVGTA